MTQLQQLKLTFDACGVTYYECDCDGRIEIGIRVGANDDLIGPVPPKRNGKSLHDYVPVFQFDPKTEEMIDYAVYV